MQRITLLCVGTLKEPWAKHACEQYAARLHAAKFEMLEIAASKDRDPQKQVADESTRLLIAAERFKGQTWALDERGIRVASPQFAELVSKAKDRGDCITLLLGGAYGLADTVRAAADLVVRLSDMTLPHELCRVLALEQLYRAQEIMKGTGYHHS